ncbi:hypothetical protein EIN_405760 [Entamoeba invadens IP1]|uniref:DNA-directed DNA polymerase n=1 Tax=Entamoeba invadens IP1 TaxID=370355 RepID=A0A0A1U6X1_ENTIV|nr:hypothetical protein EIN_405760 [Entamoeba invadens IP1]ELP90142.1 hypothetical protein EIN_405760 [Entamoeba invadens IP1]|eukprot:XP_004256913.1 hypothetical protein EIN_405760 [Entamoeba invadens IP1]
MLFENLIKFQQIEYKIIRGYYWTGNKFFKKQGNLVQEVFKLIMNSSYGKTNQKPIKTDLVYKQISVKSNKGDIQYDAERYLRKNSLLVKSFYDVAENIRCFECNKSFDDFFVPNLIGVQTLTMSKRIMNEVMCLAEDLNISIYYQDTDSKKAYCDKLSNEKNEVANHLRSKELYKKLYDGESFNFNLLQLRASFEFTKDFKNKSRSQFCRNIKFNTELEQELTKFYNTYKDKIEYAYNNRDKLYGVHPNTDSKHNLKNFLFWYL